MNIQILQTGLHAFPWRISEKNLIKDQSVLSIITPFSVDNAFILLGENWCWSLVGLKGLKRKYCYNICDNDDNIAKTNDDDGDNNIK